MTNWLASIGHRLSSRRRPRPSGGWPLLILLLAALLPTACARLLAPEIQPDPFAERVAAELRQTNAGLNRFTCVGRLSLSGPNQPVQSFRAAMAGELTDRFRIDLLSAFGGSAGTVASDGRHLFWVMHASGEYHKRRLGDGSLRRLIQLNVTVSDLLELLVGRIPVDRSLIARVRPDADGAQIHLDWVDRWGLARQRITLDEALQPLRATWFDPHGDPIHWVVFSGRQISEGFVLPQRIDLFGASGEQVTVQLERYAANAPLKDGIFTPAPLSSPVVDGHGEPSAAVSDGVDRAVARKG